MIALNKSTRKSIKIKLRDIKPWSCVVISSGWVLITTTWYLECIPDTVKYHPSNLMERTKVFQLNINLSTNDSNTRLCNEQDDVIEKKFSKSA